MVGRRGRGGDVVVSFLGRLRMDEAFFFGEIHGVSLMNEQ